MSHNNEDLPSLKWQRAMKIARGKPEQAEDLHPGDHHLHAEGANKRRIAMNQDDTDQQISSFFERQ